MGFIRSDFKVKLFNLVAVFFLCLSLGTGFFLEFFLRLMPCVTCFFQRLCMLGIGVSLCLNVIRQVRIKHYGFALLWALLGLTISLWHISCVFCDPIEEGDFLFFSQRVSTWSFITFFLSLLGLVPFLIFHKESGSTAHQRHSLLSYLAIGLLLVMLSIGLFSVFTRLGFQLRGL